MTDSRSEGSELAGALGPVAISERVPLLDITRGIAVLGILLMNIPSFGLPHATNDPSVFGGAEDANLYAWIITNLFFEGTMRGLFSLLFGAGVILLTSRMEARGGGVEVADIYYRRTLWLLVFGLVHSWIVLWHGEILYWYALVGLILFPMRKLSPRTLIVFGVLTLAMSIPRALINVNTAVDARAAAQVSQAILDDGGELDEAGEAALEEWREIVAEAKPSDEVLQDEIAAKRGGYLSVFFTLMPVIQSLQSVVFYRGAFFGIFGTMLLGMGLFKLGVLTGERSTRFYVTMMVCGYAFGLAINGYETSTLITNDFDVIAVKRWGFVGLLYEAARIPVTLGHLALIILICKRKRFSNLMSSFAAVGRMALTNYVMHSVICVFVFYGFGFGLFGQLQRFELYYVVFAIWAFQMVVSPLWLRHYRFGPLEWLWRSLTYWEWQAIRRKATPPNLAASGAA